ncbi:MAG: radical SAM protein [Prevotellaceae bacterium]|jgi:uncharacterized protein|nr:radical SAM protein [Prevotellaceae bacterium]
MTKDHLLKRLDACTGLNIIFQLTDKCVLSCRYCFAKGAHKDNLSTFKTDILQKAIKQAFETRHNNVVFEWTGGEPMLVGLDFFRKVVEFQKKYATKPFTNGVQTSGNLFDKELIDFLLENNFSISTTIDGTEEIHNKNRPANGNRPSFENVQRMRKYIMEKGRTCGFISTVTKNNLGYEGEILNFFRTLNIHSFHSNSYIYFAKNRVKDMQIALSAKDYARYFISQFNAWVDAGQEEPIPQTIDYFARCLLSGKPSNHTICTFGGRCLTNFIALTPNGDAFNCPKFTGSQNMILGNINQQDIKDILSPESTPMSKMIDDRLKAANSCLSKNCEFFYICNAGCPYYSFIRSDGENVRKRDILCEGKTLVFKYLKDVLKELEKVS